MARSSTKKRSPSPSSSASDNDDKNNTPKKKSTAHKVHKKRKHGNAGVKQRHVPKKRRTDPDDSSDSETTEEGVIDISGVTHAPAQLRELVKTWQQWDANVAGNAIRNWVDENNAKRATPKYKIGRVGIQAFKLWHQRGCGRPTASEFPESQHLGGGFGLWFQPGKTFDPEYTEDDEAMPFWTRGRQDDGSNGNNATKRKRKQ